MSKILFAPVAAAAAFALSACNTDIKPDVAYCMDMGVNDYQILTQLNGDQVPLFTSKNLKFSVSENQLEGDAVNTLNTSERLPNKSYFKVDFDTKKCFLGGTYDFTTYKLLAAPPEPSAPAV